MTRACIPATPRSLAEASICLEPIQSAGQIDAVVPDGLRRWRPITERAVRPDGVVVVTPLLNQDLGLLEAVEDLSLKQLVPKLCSDTLIRRQISPTACP